ncbi:response regulator [Aureimonas endophytica]|uniref:Response regulator n=1 Tax=Aureimonas endophytica TaxID=2027858 RepID=A0A917E7Z1_9HYPH|nr:response regulator [Aureimonas endophytica]GGE12993.1 response regulator [Aureimonas endophytica]
MAKTILIVDDSATMLMSLRISFETNGLAVADAPNAEAALDKLKGGLKPDMIVTDLNMGAMNGIELIREVRKLPGFQFLPIVLLTTESQADKRAEAKSAGATGWLVKPADEATLMKVARQLLKL